jgi:hypothetical protein
MTTEELSKNVVAAAVTADLETRLASVKVRIAEIEGQLPGLRDTEKWLEGLLSATGTPAAPEKVKVPRPRAAAAAAAVDAAAAAVVDAARPATGRKAKAQAKPKPKAAAGKRTAGRPARKKAAPAAKAPAPSIEAPSSESPSTEAVSRPSSTQRALAFLQDAASPLKAVEIAQHLFGAEATQGNVNLVRSAVETLVRRGAVSKSKQGTTVFYQAENGGKATRSEEAVEQVAAASETGQAADPA